MKSITQLWLEIVRVGNKMGYNDNQNSQWWLTWFDWLIDYSIMIDQDLKKDAHNHDDDRSIDRLTWLLLNWKNATIINCNEKTVIIWSNENEDRRFWDDKSLF